MIKRRGQAASVGSGFFRLPKFEIALAGIGGLSGIHPGSKAGFFQKEAPAFVSIGRALAVLVFAHGSFRILASLDHFDYPSGYISTNVVADEYVGRFRVVEGQKASWVAIGE